MNAVKFLCFIKLNVVGLKEICYEGMYILLTDFMM